MIAEDTAKNRHIGFIVCRKTVLNNKEKPFVRMMPGVARGIVGWRRQPAIRLHLLPVGLAFEMRTMTNRAVRTVNRLAESNQTRIYNIRSRRFLMTERKPSCCCYSHTKNPGNGLEAFQGRYPGLWATATFTKYYGAKKLLFCSGGRNYNCSYHLGDLEDPRV
jgi:hypothetical protein